MSDERVVIEAEPRTVVGKKVKQLRRTGMIPGVIYGQGGTLKVQMENLALRRALRKAGTSSLVDLNVGKETKTVIAREIQQHITRGDLLHVDFFEVDMKQTIITEADLVFVGKSAPAAEGLGTDAHMLHSLAIECLPNDLISEIEVDLTAITDPDVSIYVSDLTVPEGVTILTDPDSMVAKFDYIREEKEEEEEAAVEMAEAEAEAEEAEEASV